MLANFPTRDRQKAPEIAPLFNAFPNAEFSFVSAAEASAPHLEKSVCYPGLLLFRTGPGLQWLGPFSRRALCMAGAEFSDTR
jgi:hypothetical protein